MKLLRGFVYISSVLGFTLNSPNINYGITLQTLKDIKHTLRDELKSLVAIPQLSHHQSANDLLILPSNMLNAEIYNKLGFGFLGQDSFRVNWHLDQLQVPKDFKNLFIFNTTTSLGIPDKNLSVLADFLDNSFPFDLPKFMNLKTHCLVLPRKYLQTKLGTANLGKSNWTNNTDVLMNSDTIFAQGVLQASSTDLPILRSVVSDDKPLMMFVFSDSDGVQFKNSKTPIMNVKNYLKAEKSLISGFFDGFAKSWMNLVNYESLISSMFCTTNPHNTESYCLQIHKDQLHLFPAFLGLTPSFRTGDRNTTKVNAQMLHQVHDKLTNLAHKFKDISYELGQEYSELLDRTDDKVELKQSVYDKVGDTKETLATAFDDIKDMVENGIGYVKQGVHDSLKMATHSKRHETFNEADTVNEAKLIMPLSLVRIAEHKIPTPRNKHYSQIALPNLTKRFSIFSNDRKTCESITWYNVFHHSIFGKPNFCLD